MLTIYNLAPLVATVARVDPNTGEKINKLRKSYEGQLKVLRLAGRNKAIRHDDYNVGMSLPTLAHYPSDEWYNQTIGKDLFQGLPPSTLANLDSAMNMNPGPVPKSDEWENILGHEKLKHETKPNGVKKRGPETIRPKRETKKRRYNDDSFEGYGEGFEDDRDEPSSDGQSNASRKKRRKVRPPSFTINADIRSLSMRPNDPAFPSMLEEALVHMGEGDGVHVPGYEVRIGINPASFMSSL